MPGAVYDGGGASRSMVLRCLLQRAVGFHKQWRRLFMLKTNVAHLVTAGPWYV